MRRKLAPDVQTGSGFTVGTLAGILTYVLVTFVPAWHNGLPPDVSNVLPMVAGIMLYFITSYTVNRKIADIKAEQKHADENPVLSL